MSYGNLESLRCTTEGEEAARRNSMNNAMTSFDIKYLKRVAKGTRFSDVRYAAESRISELKSLSRKQRKEKEQEYKNKEEEKKKLAEQFNKAAEEKDSPEYWLKKLYGNYVTENSYGRELIEKGLLAYGDGMYPNVRAYVFSLARAFHEFTGGIREIRYATDEGRRTGAVIDKHSESLEKAIDFAKKAGCQISVHAMGGQAIDRIVDRICDEEDWTDGSVPYLRVEHLTEPSEQAMQKASEKGFAFASQPIFEYCEIETYRANMDQERLEHIYPHRTELEHGIRLCFSTDAPATSWAVPSDPFPNLKSAVTRKGYSADFAVLSEDIFTAAPDRIDRIRVEETFIRGERVYQR